MEDNPDNGRQLPAGVEDIAQIFLALEPACAGAFFYQVFGNGGNGNRYLNHFRAGVVLQVMGDMPAQQLSPAKRPAGPVKKPPRKLMPPMAADN